MLDDILTAIPFGVILAFTIGPVFFVLLETSATKGFRSALVFDIGVIIADIIFIALAYYSIEKTGLLEKVIDDPNFLVFGGVLLAVYGLSSFIKTSRSYRDIVKEYQKVEIQKDYIKLFLKGFLLNFINIGVLLGWLGFLAIGKSITKSENGAIIFIIAMLTSYFITDIFKILIAKRLRSKLTPRRVYKTKKIVAIIILVFGVSLLIQGLFPEAYQKNKEKLEQINPIKSD